MIKIINTGKLDNESRPVYKDDTGNYYVDIDLGKSEKPNIHVVTDEGEPMYPLKNYELIDSANEESFMRMRAGAKGPVFETKLNRHINNIKRLF